MDDDSVESKTRGNYNAARPASARRKPNETETTETGEEAWIEIFLIRGIAVVV